MNNRLELICKETVTANSRHYPGICLERPRNTTRTLKSGKPVSLPGFELNTCPNKSRQHKGYTNQFHLTEFVLLPYTVFVNPLYSYL